MTTVASPQPPPLQAKMHLSCLVEAPARSWQSGVRSRKPDIAPGFVMGALKDRTRRAAATDARSAPADWLLPGEFRYQGRVALLRCTLHDPASPATRGRTIPLR